MGRDLSLEFDQAHRCPISIASATPPAVRTLVQLSDQLSHVAMYNRERFVPFGCCAIEASPRTSHSHFADLQIPAMGQAMQKRVDRTGADPVAVPLKLLKHAKPKNLLFDCVIQHVQLHKAG